ncbi:MAG TPA: hypothetical protein VES66_04460 [Terriglobales bacterium]|nr:hypothetical protein [Terriglobales bacterium]
MPEPAASQEECAEAHPPADPVVSALWQAIRFVFHLGCVYLVALYGTAWLTARFRVWVLPLFDHEPVSSFQFFYSHLLVFNFVSASIAALAYSRYRHRVACYVWIVPAAILAYKFLTFGIVISHSVFGTSVQKAGVYESAFHHYFGGAFSIPEYYSYRELFAIAASNPDMQRGVDQYHFTAPFYAGAAYSMATYIAIRLRLPSIVDLFRRLRRD